MTGYCIAAKINKRTDTLEVCIALLKRIRSEISYCAEPLSVILKKAADSNEFSSLTFLTSFTTMQSDNIPCLWADSVENFYVNSSLNRDDADCIKSFGSKLGTTDVEHQKKLCDEFIEILEERHDILKMKRNEQIKLCKICSFALAIIELIMLL